MHAKCTCPGVTLSLPNTGNTVLHVRNIWPRSACTHAAPASYHSHILSHGAAATMPGDTSHLRRYLTLKEIPHS